MFVDYFFIVDIFFNFFAAIREEDGSLDTRNKSIAISYIKGWFLFDFIASFPTEDVINIAIKYGPTEVDTVGLEDNQT